ncbi:MAG TPA: glycosyltransferase family 1 protein [Verrucomicrobiae bacterium]|nr:glycosyltransferase family 1 protein [Verrucomicrobiae bacterium]
MRIAVDAREICGRPAGKGQYLLRILNEWRDGDDAVFCYVHPGQKIPSELRGRAIEQVEVAGRSLFWHRAAAKQALQDKAQVFFASQSYLSALFCSVPTVTVVHDLAVFVLKNVKHNAKANAVEKASLRRSLKRSAAVIAVSQATAKDVQEIGKCPPDKLHVIGEAPLLMDARPLPLSARDGSLLFVGTLEPRKNILSLLKAYAGLREEERQKHPLILVGKQGWGGEDYEGVAEKLGISTTCRFEGYLSTEELVSRFQKARCFAYLSHYEGFGLPVIEAMAAGTPVLVSNTPALTELVADTGRVCDPQDIDGITASLRALLEDDTLAQKMSDKALKRAQGYSWETVAAQVRDLLSSVATAP